MPLTNPELYGPNKTLTGLLCSFNLSVYGVIAFCCCVCAHSPRSEIFISFIIPKLFDKFFFIELITISFHSYLYVVLAHNAVLILGCVIIYVLYVPSLLTKELLLGPSVRYRTSENLRSSANIRYTFRAFQLFNENAMQQFGVYLPISQVILTFHPIFGGCILLRYWPELKSLTKAAILLGGPSAMFTWLFILQAGKDLQVEGNKMLWSWRKYNVSTFNTIEAKIMRKFGKSCRPILIHYGNIFVIERMSQFTYIIKGVVWGTLRARLAL